MVTNRFFLKCCENNGNLGVSAGTNPVDYALYDGDPHKATCSQETLCHFILKKGTIEL